MDKPHIHPTACIDTGAVIGNNTHIWHFCHIMTASTIGSDCNIGQNCVISPEVKIGDRVKIQNNVSVYTGVCIENDVFIGPSVVFTNVTNPRAFISRRNQFRPTIVREGASIGANATIICGNTIGRYSMIGAGAVVTHDVAQFSLVAGNPARHIYFVSRLGHRLHFDSDNIAICPESGEQYELSNTGECDIKKD